MHCRKCLFAYSSGSVVIITKNKMQFNTLVSASIIHPHPSVHTSLSYFETTTYPVIYFVSLHILPESFVMPIIHYPHHKIWMRHKLELGAHRQIKSIYNQDRLERCCGGMAASIAYIMCYFMIVWWLYLGSPHKWLNSYQESTYVN